MRHLQKGSGSFLQVRVILDIFCTKDSGRPLPLSLRSDVWTHCLEISERKSRVEKFDDVYDHPEQSAIHQVEDSSVPLFLKI